MQIRFLQFPKGSLGWLLSNSGVDRSIPDLALLVQPISLSEAGNENAYERKIGEQVHLVCPQTCF